MGVVAGFRGVSEGDVVRFAIAKPEPLRTEHEAFRDAVLGKPADIVTMEQGARDGAGGRGGARGSTFRSHGHALTTRYRTDDGAPHR